MLIDCDRCVVRGESCADCMVTALLTPEREDVGAGAVTELDAAERRALSVLAGSGLIPPLRLVPTADAGESRQDRVSPRISSSESVRGIADWRAVG